MSPQQIPMPLPVTPFFAEDDFMPAASNAAAAQMLQLGAQPIILLLGPRGSGKTHLAYIWQRRHKAALIYPQSFAPEQVANAPALLWEDADRTPWNEETQKSAFHLLNMAREHKKPLLITAATAPLNWPLQLADLRSRLLALPVATIDAPDDTLVAALLLKHLKDRQLKVSEDVLNYLIPRLPRDGHVITEIVRAIDSASLADRRAVTIPFVKSILEKSASLFD